MPTLDPRPVITPAIEALLLDVTSRVPQFAGIEPTDILVVGLAAHGHVVASVRALQGMCRSVTVGGKKRVIELGLRPGFFLEGDAPRRLATIVHELLHLDPAGPGRLLEANSHRHRSHAAHEKEARSIAKSYLKDADAVRILCLAHEGEVFLRQWRRRPFESTAKLRFDDDDLFDGVVHMHTPEGARGGWW